MRLRREPHHRGALADLFQHVIDNLQMVRVRGKREVHGVIIEHAVRRGAEVILDVA